MHVRCLRRHRRSFGCHFYTGAYAISRGYNAQSTTVLRGLATGENLTWRNGFLPHWEPNDSYSRGRDEESLVAARSSLRSNFRHHEVEVANGKVRRRLLVERSSPALRISKFDFFGPTR